MFTTSSLTAACGLIFDRNLKGVIWVNRFFRDFSQQSVSIGILRGALNRRILERKVEKFLFQCRFCFLLVKRDESFER